MGNSFDVSRKAALYVKRSADFGIEYKRFKIKLSS